MSKGLEALKRLKWGYAITHEERIELCECIETELKASELAIDFINRIADLFKEHDLDELEDKIIKTKKALEIIKNIGILKPYETSGGHCWLETMCDAVKIAKENCDLLKEVLL